MHPSLILSLYKQWNRINQYPTINRQPNHSDPFASTTKTLERGRGPLDISAGESSRKTKTTVASSPSRLPCHRRPPLTQPESIHNGEQDHPLRLPLVHAHRLPRGPTPNARLLRHSSPAERYADDCMSLSRLHLVPRNRVNSSHMRLLCVNWTIRSRHTGLFIPHCLATRSSTEDIKLLMVFLSSNL
jgi:hypothetical protein